MDQIHPITTVSDTVFSVTVKEPCDVTENATEPLGSPAFNAQQREKWNEPRVNSLRLASTYLSFFLLGCNDSSYGVGEQRSAVRLAQRI